MTELCEPCYGGCPECVTVSVAAASEPVLGDVVEARGRCQCFPANDKCPGQVGCGLGHPEYLNLLEELRALHKTKSGGYGTGADPMANYTAISGLTGQPRYLYPVHRSIEKLARVLSLHAQGRTGELEEEFLDTASSLLCAAAMLREDAA